MGKELEIKSYELTNPSEVVAMANVLKEHIVKHKLYTPIVGKNYVMVEGWQFAGGMLGLRPIVSLMEDMSSEKELKWKAKVKIMRGEELVSVGYAVCSNKENKKKNFDEYAIMSMAQTRAIGKAYRNIIGWVIKLAGYESTPSEEIKNEVKSKIEGQAKKATKTAHSKAEELKKEILNGK